MMKQLTTTLLEEMTRCLVAEFQPESVILFGSYAWGAPIEDSDVDLLVIMSTNHIPSTERAARA
jgi:predicted nucleotidyltransferase